VNTTATTETIENRIAALGKTQQSVLRTLAEKGVYYYGCAWVWTNDSTTVRVLETLVKRGLVTEYTRDLPNASAGMRAAWRPTPEVSEHFRTIERVREAEATARMRARHAEQRAAQVEREAERAALNDLRKAHPDEYAVQLAAHRVALEATL
jgi:hypothetical protein